MNKQTIEYTKSYNPNASLIKGSDNRYSISEPVTEEQMYQLLLALLEKRYLRADTLTSPDLVKKYLQVKMAQYEREVFSCIFVDAQHRVIAYQELFFGTLDSASVYPREIVKRSLELNAAAVVFAHNHPSGLPEPSQADIRITERLKEALALVGVTVLDHIIIGGIDSMSFAERSLL